MTKNFDPFNASEDEARSQSDANGVPDGSFWKWQTAQLIKHDKARHEAMPLVGIAECFKARINPPDWLISAFLKQFNLVKEAKVRTWGEAFGELHPQGVHLETLKQKNDMGLLGYLVENGLLEQLFSGPNRYLFGDGLPRTSVGYKKASVLVGIPVKTIKRMLPKTRNNVRGGKHRTKAVVSLNFNDPFNLNQKSS